MKVVTGKERQKLIYQLGEVINTKQFLKHTESEMNVEQSNESHEKSFWKLYNLYKKKFTYKFLIIPY